MKIKDSFWITNISNMNISLSDLNLTVKAFSSVNLLDNKHYFYTKEQLMKSSKEGSLFKKKDRIFIRKIPPEIYKNNILSLNNSNIPSRERSIFVLKEEKYEELNCENADLAEMDSQQFTKKV